MRILALALGVPFPPIGGGLTRTFHLLKSLTRRHEVTLAAFTYGEGREPSPYPIEIVSVPWQWSDAYNTMTGADAEASREAYERLTYREDEPWFASVMDRTGMERAIERIVCKPFDLVLIEGTPLAAFIPALPREVPRIIDLLDVHSVMARRSLERASAGDDRASLEHEAARTLIFERSAIQRCSACLAVSPAEADAVRTMLGASQVQIVPNGVDTSYFAPSDVTVPEPDTIVFTGRMSYPPNVDAACYFAREVLPLVRKEIPDARFRVVGAAPPAQVTALASNAVVVHGRVDDVRPYLWRAAVVVAPVREGGGTRLKVLEAAASAKAIVSTTLGASGLELRAPDHLLLADSPPEFADGVIQLLRDPERRQLMGSRARIVAHQYDWSRIGTEFLNFVEEIVARV